MLIKEIFNKAKTDKLNSIVSSSFRSDYYGPMNTSLINNNSEGKSVKISFSRCLCSSIYHSKRSL